MAETKELKTIKKLYGEKFMHLCRRLFPTILEQEGLLTEILKSSFATNSRTLGEDITEELEETFKNYIFSKVDEEQEKVEIIVKETPYRLLEEAGYDLFECKSEDDIQSFKKYYKKGEELCTFRGDRLDSCVVFWAVKKDVDRIKREDFKNPKREDEYGTSVMSIQFSRGYSSTVSIKNRYNSKVNNPDATYGNNLNRIIPGLKQSFVELLSQRGMNLNSLNIEEFSIPNYVVAPDGKYYKYNMEINGIYYCPGNVIIDHGNIIQLESEKQVLIDYFVLDKENKTLKLYDKKILDSFVDCFKNIEKIEMKKSLDKKRQTRIITIQIKDNISPIIIEIDKDNNIVGYDNQQLTEVGNQFLMRNKKIKEINLPNLTEAGYNFLFYNDEITEVHLPKLTKVDDGFISVNKKIMELNSPKLVEVGNNFFSMNKQIRKVSLPVLTKAGDGFFSHNNEISKIDLPSLRETGDDFFGNNKKIREINLPHLIKVGRGFLNCIDEIYEIYLPHLTKVNDGFFRHNKQIGEINLPHLTEAGEDFLYNNNVISKVNLPELKEVGDCFLYNNKEIREIYVPNLIKVGYEYLSNNHSVKKLVSNIIKNNKHKNKIQPKDIVELDKENQLTTTEISFGRKFIESIKNMFHKKSNEQR